MLLQKASRQAQFEVTKSNDIRSKLKFFEAWRKKLHLLRKRKVAVQTLIRIREKYRLRIRLAAFSENTRSCFQEALAV